MREICVPIPIGIDAELAEVEVKIGNKNIRIQYRLESFPWEVKDQEQDGEDDITDNLMKIYQLKKTIADYDKDWELIQIFTPADNARHIQILFRKK